MGRLQHVLSGAENIIPMAHTAQVKVKSEPFVPIGIWPIIVIHHDHLFGLVARDAH